MSHVLVTGAAGSLGHVLVPELARRGHRVRQLDRRPADPAHEMVVGDVREVADLRPAMAGIDVVVHRAAIHGIHLGGSTPADFWDLDAIGTFTVYDTARQAGTVTKVALCSSMAVYGASAQRGADAWAVVTDESPVLPTDAYGLAKHVAETLACDAARTIGSRSSLTCPMRANRCARPLPAVAAMTTSRERDQQRYRPAEALAPAYRAMNPPSM